MYGCKTFDFDLKNVECCQLCHGSEDGHSMAGVKGGKGEIIAEVCHPVAERLRALGYLFEEALHAGRTNLGEEGAQEGIKSETVADLSINELLARAD